MGKKLFFMALCLSFCAIFLGRAIAAGRIVVVADKWMPYNGEPGAAQEGYAVDILRTVFERSGYEVEYVKLPWKRAMDDVRIGRADILIGAVKADTDGFIYPEQSLGRADLCFFTNRTDWQFTGPESLETVMTGYIQGHTYPEWLLNDIKLHPERFHALHGEDAFVRMLGMLQENRIQVIPAVRDVAEYYIKRNGLQGEVYYAGGREVDTLELYFALSPASPLRSRQLADLLDKGLSTMRNTGQLHFFLIKYGLKDWMTLH